MALGAGYIPAGASLANQASGYGLRRPGDSTVVRTMPVPPTTVSLAEVPEADLPVAQEYRNSAPSSRTTIERVGYKVQSMGEYWFERLHLTPKSIEYGNILGNVNSTIEIYNSSLSESRLLSTFINGAGDGLSITNLPSLPYLLPPQSGLSLNILVTTSGVPTFDDTLRFSFDGLTLYLAVSGSRIIVLPFVPETPFLEKLSFLTNVMEKTGGSEQRVSARLSPRLSYEMTFHREYGDEYARFESLFYDWQHRVFGLPMWHEPAVTTQELTTGQTTVSVRSTANMSLQVGGLAVVYQDESHFSSLEVTAFTETTITFASPVDVDYPVGVEVYPIRTAIAEPVVRSSRKVLGMATVTMLMRALDSSDLVGSTSGFSLYNSKVLLDEPNMLEGEMRESLERRMYVHDSETGKFSQTSLWNRFRRSSNKTFFCNTRDRLTQIRNLLCALRGRQVSFYLPTFNKQLTPTQDLTLGQTSMTVSNCGYARFVQSRDGRNIIRLRLAGGTVYTRTIISASEVSLDEEQLNFSESWPTNVPVGNIEAIDFYEKVRLDSDEITIEHRDTNGQAKVRVPVKGVID